MTSVQRALTQERNLKLTSEPIRTFPVVHVTDAKSDISHRRGTSPRLDHHVQSASGDDNRKKFFTVANRVKLFKLGAQKKVTRPAKVASRVDKHPPEPKTIVFTVTASSQKERKVSLNKSASGDDNRKTFPTVADRDQLFKLGAQKKVTRPAAVASRVDKHPPEPKTIVFTVSASEQKEAKVPVYQSPSPQMLKTSNRRDAKSPAAKMAEAYLSIPYKSAEEQTDTGAVQERTLANIYRSKVIDAYRNRKIFTVFGNYNTIRRALIKRGWLEKLPPGRLAKLQTLPEEVLLQHAKRGNEYETVAISKIINHFPAFFVWQHRGQRDLYGDVLPYRNRIRRTHMLDFSTKVGLIGCAEQQKWYLQEGVAGMLYPRFYRLGANQEEHMAFVDDYRNTHCRCLLLYLVKQMDRPDDVIDPETGAISPIIVHFALGRVRRQLDEFENVVSLDKDLTQIPDSEWNDFITNSSKVISMVHKLKCSHREFYDFAKTARLLLTKIEEKRPDYRWDGFKNLWILKPGYQSRGLGIIIRNTIDEILRWSTSHTSRRYIVQKYIEQPLLIYQTKFDIRQYMLVFIRESTVQIWLYKDCYLRFSSTEYSTDDLREVVHLTNNSVQKRYKNKPTRDSRLPKNNMWSLDQFKVYLKLEGLPDDAWESKVFAGIRENLIAVVMASLDETNLCENSFELYGCDFMLDEQYHPILIEINSTPDLSASTEVTAQICPMVMQDCIKVVVDLPRNSRALTGQFQLAYEVSYKFKQDADLKDGLNVSGKSMALRRRERLVSTQPKPVKKVAGGAGGVGRRPEVELKPRSAGGSDAGSKAHVPSGQPRRVKHPAPANASHSLNSTTRQALALRYTMPK